MAGMVLAENGAEVVLVEPPGGSGDRGRPGHRVWNRAKRSVVLDLTTDDGRADLATLAATSDAAIVALRPGRVAAVGADADALEAANPGLVHVQITGFGTRGPLAELDGYEGVSAAVSGRMATLGGERPVFVPVPIASYGAGLLAVQALLAGLYQRRRTGRGMRLHTSLLQALSAYDMISGIGNRTTTTSSEGHVFGVMRVAFMTAPTADGRHLQMCSRQPHHYRRWLTAMGLEELLAAPDLAHAPDLYPSEERLEEVVALIRQQMQKRTRDEWMEIFLADDIGGDPFLGAQEYLEHPQCTLNGRSHTVHDPEVGDILQVGPLGGFSRTPSVIGAPAPALGTDTVASLVGGRVLRPTSVPSGAASLPLEGVTVVECGYFYATPFASTLLAELGARVIKVEPNAGDPGRRNWTTPYVKAMVGKESVVLDLKSDDGRRIMGELVDGADVFIHNFRPGTPARLGIDHDSLLERNPRLVYVYGSCFGSEGPWSAKAGFHSSPNAISGAGIIEAGEGNPPINRTYADPASALATAACVMVGLEARERTGEGQYLETVMLTSMAYAVSEWSAAWPAKPDRVVDGGLHGFSALHRLYPLEDGSWLYLEAPRQRQWEALCRTIGRADLPTDPRFVTTQARADHDDELIGELTAALAGRSADEWSALLVAAGVAAVRADGIDHGEFMLAGEQARATGAAVQTTQPGLPDYWRAGFAIDIAGVRREPAPSAELGSHTAAVLTELGYSRAELDRMDADGVTTAVGIDLPS